MPIGSRIKRLRKRQDMTQGQLAVYSGVAQSHISKLENNRIDSMGSEALARIARCLGTTTDYLLVDHGRGRSKMWK